MRLSEWSAWFFTFALWTGIFLASAPALAHGTHFASEEELTAHIQEHWVELDRRLAQAPRGSPAVGECREMTYHMMELRKLRSREKEARMTDLQKSCAGIFPPTAATLDFAGLQNRRAAF